MRILLRLVLFGGVDRAGGSSRRKSSQAQGPCRDVTLKKVGFQDEAVAGDSPPHPKPQVENPKTAAPAGRKTGQKVRAYVRSGDDKGK